VEAARAEYMAAGVAGTGGLTMPELERLLLAIGHAGMVRRRVAQAFEAMGGTPVRCVQLPALETWLGQRPPPPKLLDAEAFMLEHGESGRAGLAPAHHLAWTAVPVLRWHTGPAGGVRGIQVRGGFDRQFSLAHARAHARAPWRILP
jgi:hypothetical protein